LQKASVAKNSRIMKLLVEVLLLLLLLLLLDRRLRPDLPRCS
jgi:hypothetical protein